MALQAGASEARRLLPVITKRRAPSRSCATTRVQLNERVFNFTRERVCPLTFKNCVARK